MKPHLLLTAWAFPPARTSGVYRAAGIADAFAAAGWRVTVLCGPADLFTSSGVSDASLVATRHPGVRVIEVGLEHPELSTDIAQWSRLRARQPELWAKLRLRRDLRAFPEPWYGSWAAPLRRAAEQVHRDDPVSVTLGTAAPYVDFVPGEHLYRRAGVPYVLDYRDAWTFRTFTGQRPADLADDVPARESALIRDALRVWFVNDPIRHWHEEAYPGAAARMRTVRNGFDLPAGTTDPRALGVPLRHPASPLTFGYVGTINFGAFPLEEVVAGWRRARPQLPERSSLVLRGHLGRTGQGSPALRGALAAAEEVGIHYLGPVPRGDVWQVYRDFDALLLALPSGPGVTSGKVYEYAATGLPIVSVHTPETPVHEVLGDAPHWCPVPSLGAQDIAAAFLAAADCAQRATVDERQRAIDDAARWERSRLLVPAVEDLTAALGAAG